MQKNDPFDHSEYLLSFTNPISLKQQCSFLFSPFYENTQTSCCQNRRSPFIAIVVIGMGDLWDLKGCLYNSREQHHFCQHHSTLHHTPSTTIILLPVTTTGSSRCTFTALHTGTYLTLVCTSIYHLVFNTHCMNPSTSLPCQWMWYPDTESVMVWSQCHPSSSFHASPSPHAVSPS